MPKNPIGHQFHVPARKLTNLAIVDATAGEPAKTLGATSSGMARGGKIYHLVGPPLRGLIRADVTIGVLSQGVNSNNAMGPLKLRNTIGLCIGTHHCPVNEANPGRTTPNPRATLARAMVAGPRRQGSN